jgi:hypothetical protein
MCGASRDSSHVACDAASAASPGGRRGIREPSRRCNGRGRIERPCRGACACALRLIRRGRVGGEKKNRAHRRREGCGCGCRRLGAIVHLSSDVINGWVDSASQHIAARPAPQSAARLFPAMRCFAQRCLLWIFLADVSCLRSPFSAVSSTALGLLTDFPCTELRVSPSVFPCSPCPFSTVLGDLRSGGIDGSAFRIPFPAK